MLDDLVALCSEKPGLVARLMDTASMFDLELSQSFVADVSRDPSSATLIALTTGRPRCRRYGRISMTTSRGGRLSRLILLLSACARYELNYRRRVSCGPIECGWLAKRSPIVQTISCPGCKPR